MSWPTQLSVLWREFSQVPTYHLLLEGFLFLWVAWLLFRRVTKSRSRSHEGIRLTKEEEEELLAEWKPEPLVPEIDPNHPALHVPIVSGKPGKYVTVNDIKCLDMATHNYLGFAGNVEIEKAAVETIRKYGVGSCGPRGFYGTVDVHVHLEERLANFLGTGQAVLYSYGFSTIASAIPAYAKKGDIIFVDECVNFPIQKGLDASRSKIKFFRHNDCDHLEQLLTQQAVEDKKNPKLAKVSRRFLVVEGIYMNTGQICDIQRIVELKHKYKLRLFIDESVSFGSLGQHGKGITEHANISMDDLDMIMASLENGIGSIGGFVAGTSFVVEHQTLAGLGYCFSAALPPLLATATKNAIDIMDQSPSMFDTLHENCEHVQDAFSNIHGLELFGDRISPIKHLQMSTKFSASYCYNDRQKIKKIMQQIVDSVRLDGLALTLAAYLEEAEVKLPPVSIRLTTSVQLTKEDIFDAARKLNDTSKNIFEQLPIQKKQDDA